MRRDFDSIEFKEMFHYEQQLGIKYDKERTIFSLWSPLAEKVEIEFYNKGDNDEVIDYKTMIKTERGVWKVEKSGDCHGLYYLYKVYFKKKINTVVDPYAISLGVNGNKAMVIDMKRTNPEGWEHDLKPKLECITDSIIYEAHIRDLSIDENSGVTIRNRGKFRGVVENNTVIPKTNVLTTLGHLKELGITHIHLLPVFDYGSVDESRYEESQYNWGYDPVNYNTPEGSYSSNPFLGEVRIKEFKEMVQVFHKNGIRVIMDVVYNHTFFGEKSNLNLSMPGYFHRYDSHGNFSNGSGCGNELASERSMVRKYIMDSLIYWATEYHIDGFRFDLMALHDIDTLKLIRSELDKIDKSIITYGEGWTGGKSVLNEKLACFKKNMKSFDKLQIAAFSDDIRDGIKGNVVNKNESGFINGMEELEETIKFGVVAATQHDDIDYSKVNYSKEPWANEPYQTITYCSAHDNYTLWDKLHVVSPKISEEEAIRLNKLAIAIVLTSQGIPFIHAGEELARTKVDEKGTFVDNSYASSDKVNKIYWDRKIKYMDLFKYYKGLIQLRKENKAFRLSSNNEIQEYITFLKKEENFKEDNIVAYNINGQGNLQGWNNISVIYNSNEYDVEVKLLESHWNIVVNGKCSGVESLGVVNGNKVIVSRKSCFVLIKK